MSRKGLKKIKRDQKNQERGQQILKETKKNLKGLKNTE